MAGKAWLPWIVTGVVVIGIAVWMTPGSEITARSFFADAVLFAGIALVLVGRWRRREAS